MNGGAAPPAPTAAALQRCAPATPAALSAHGTALLTMWGCLRPLNGLIAWHGRAHAHSSQHTQPKPYSPDSEVALAGRACWPSRAAAVQQTFPLLFSHGSARQQFICSSSSH